MTTYSPAILVRLTTVRADYTAGVSPYYDEVLDDTAWPWWRVPSTNGRHWRGATAFSRTTIEPCATGSTVR
ncbi:hypothetical protein [Dermacoccus sp. CCH2-D9]|uniref:hypothetical protein n=1 Tax=Dermacoccus sp. CCH2-D9 TaxID=1768779 RepID=UPI000780E5B8|nr:hypothetical protein [Dermacoccus sp. CCH2-D9]